MENQMSTQESLFSLFPSISEVLLRQKDFDTALNQVLKQLGESTDADRVYFFKNSEINGENYVFYDAEWCREGISPEIDNPDLNGACWNDLGQFAIDFLKVRSIHGDVDIFPYPEVAALLEPQGIQSVLMVKVEFEGTFLGFVGFDSCLAKREWSEEEVRLMEYLSAILAHRMVRENASAQADILLEKLSRRNVFLAKIREIQAAFMRTPDDDRHFQQLLEAALAYSGASLGLLVAFKKPRNSKIHYDLLANNKDAWEAGIPEHLKLLVEVKKEDYRWLIGNKEPLVLHIDEYIDEKYFVKGGIPLDNLISLPVCYGEQLVGCITMANFPGKISGDIIKELDLLVDISGSLLHNHKLNRGRVEYENKIVGQRKAFEAIFETTLSGYWDWNMLTNEEYLSPGLKKGLGYKDHEMPNKPDSWMMMADEEDLKGLFRSLDAHIQSRGKKPFKQEVRFTHKKGHIVKMLVGGGVFEWTPEGDPERIMGCHIDITDSARMQDKLIANLEKEKELNRLKSHFVSLVSHQFRTPMSIVRSNAELIRFKLKDRGDALSLVENNLYRIENELDWLNDLLERVLTMEKTKFKSGGQNTTTVVDVVTLLNGMVYDFNTLNPDKKVNYNKRVDSAFIKGDEAKLRHIFNNLLSNAYKYGGEKPPVVSVYKTGSKVYVEILDKGIGILSQEIENIFNPFQRGSNVGDLTGTGLGLAIVKEFMDEIQGKIRVKSTRRGGTVFTLLFTLETEK
jgi:PAS domain S-box-containing protein